MRTTASRFVLEEYMARIIVADSVVLNVENLAHVIRHGEQLPILFGSKIMVCEEVVSSVALSRFRVKKPF